MELTLELSLKAVLHSLIYFSITRRIITKRTGLAPDTKLNFYEYNAVTRNPPKVELEDTTKP